MNFVKTILKTIYRRLFCGKLYYFERRFAKEQKNDMRYLDREIERYALEINPLDFEKKTIDNRIVFLASELYDFGGHTEVIKNIIESLPVEYESKLFLIHKSRTFHYAPVKIKHISQFCEIDGINAGYTSDKKNLLRMFNKITKFKPKAIFVFIHNNDVFSVALLACLKKWTKIKIFYSDTASHQFSIGMSFADLILEGMPSTAFITQKYRGFKNTFVSRICYLPREKLPIITENLRKEILPSDALCTVSGAAAYKFFENDNSLYLEMIKRLLEKNENLYHILITELTPRYKRIFDSIFKNSFIKNRIKILNFTPNFKSLFKCADVFIDSFPISSAFTMIDLMSLKIPIVVKMNKNNIAFSFHEYLAPNYPYMFENIQEMEIGIENLLFNKEQREQIAQTNYEYFLNFYEGKKYTKNLIDLINCEDLNIVYDKEINENQYKDFKKMELLPFPYGLN
jgi:ABC-type cobalt transport system substrate-binding protein